MDPFARKMWRFGFGFAFVMLLAFTATSVVYFHARPRCSDVVVSTAASPARQWTAVVMERRCGDEEPFFTHVNLRPAGQPLRYGFFSGAATEGEIFHVEQDALSAGVTLNWTAPDHLAIRCAGCSPSLVRRQTKSWDSVTITYETTSR